MEQALLPGEEARAESWRSYQYLGRTTSSSLRASPYTSPAAGAGQEVTIEEIRSASALSSDRYYPPSIHGALVTSPDPDHPCLPQADQAIVFQGGYGD